RQAQLGLRALSVAQVCCHLNPRPYGVGIWWRTDQPDPQEPVPATAPNAVLEELQPSGVIKSDDVDITVAVMVQTSHTPSLGWHVDIPFRRPIGECAITVVH